MKKLIYPLMLLMSAISVFAQGDFLMGGFQTIGGFLYDLITNDYAMFGLSVFFLFMILFAVIGAALKHVKIFEGQGGLGLNAAGKLFTFAVSAISTTALFAWKPDIGFFIPTIFGGLGVYSSFILGLILFLVLLRAFKDRTFLRAGNVTLSLLVTGIFLWWLGSTAGSRASVLIGVLTFITALIIWIGKGLKARTVSAGSIGRFFWPFRRAKKEIKKEQIETQEAAGEAHEIAEKAAHGAGETKTLKDLANKNGEHHG